MASGGTGTGPGPLPGCQTPSVQGGPVAWGVHQNRDYSRDYSVTYLVRGTHGIHGPYAALYAAGLPRANTVWMEGTGAVEDPWAWFTGERTVRQKPDEREGGNQFWLVDCLATTRPTQDCIAQGINSPFAIPDRIRIESITYTKEGTEDRFGAPLVNSVWEQFRGPQAEYDNSRFRVYIEQNTPGPLPLDFYESLLHHLNDAPLWGFAARRVKFSHFEAEPRYYSNCVKYWIAKFMFDIAFDFDRCLLDEGTQVLRGRWEKNPASPNYGQYVLGTTLTPIFMTPVYVAQQNPSDIIQYQDWNGNPARVILNGNGRPYRPAPYGTQTGSITNATNATPIVITSANYNLVTGDEVTITGVTGNTAANGVHKITSLSTTTFSLNGTTGNGAYGGGGTWTYTSTPGKFCYEYYDQGNLLTLGIPATLG